jgi:tetratricopeptide (TPR) repeat protein
MLFPPLLAFAYWLERQLRLAEALDVLDTATRLSDGGVGEEEVQLWLQRGRVLRLSGRFDDAMDAYRSAGDLARAMEDRHSELLSRIGRGIVLMHLGNLPESERVLQRVLVEAREHGDRDAEARASQDLGNTYCHMQRTGLAIPLLFDAYRLYTDRVHQLRALSDLGIALKELGQLQAAEHAFVVVAGGEAPQGVRLTAALEVIETSVLRHDRVAFERWKRAVEAHVDAMPYLAVDFAEKVGLGYEHFGNRRLAAKHLSRALEMAERFGFNQRVFRIEQLRNDLEAGALEEPAVPQPHFDDAVRESLRTVAARLERDRLRHDSEAAMASSTAGTGL